MFQRRDKRTLGHRVLNFFWPEPGLKRSSAYLFHRMARLPGTSYSLAAGFACGAAISFTPFVGLHFIFSALLALAIRANVIASAIGTAIGNPWTFPFIWVFVYNTGQWLGAGSREKSLDSFDFGKFFASMMEAFLRFDLSYFIDTAWPVFWPMFVGSLPVGAFIWIIFYAALKPLIGTYQSNRVEARKRGNQKK
jgi:uncharacterized protein